jgi:hypothetical protein
MIAAVILIAGVILTAKEYGADAPRDDWNNQCVRDVLNSKLGAKLPKDRDAIIALCRDYYRINPTAK